MLVETNGALIAIESKRYEPFRKTKSQTLWSDAYWREVWGPHMAGYELGLPRDDQPSHSHCRLGDLSDQDDTTPANSGRAKLADGEM